MTRDTAQRRGLNPRRVAEMRPDDIGFFDTLDELEDALISAGWAPTRRGDSTLYELSGCDALVLVSGSGLVAMQVEGADGKAIEYGRCRLGDVMMIGGSLVVGASVEI